jgi:hypothetical protein
MDRRSRRDKPTTLHVTDLWIQTVDLERMSLVGWVTSPRGLMNGLVFFGIACLLMGAWQAAWSSNWSKTVGGIWKSMGFVNLEKTPAYWRRFSLVSATLFAAVGLFLLFGGIISS